MYKLVHRFGKGDKNEDGYVSNSKFEFTQISKSAPVHFREARIEHFTVYKEQDLILVRLQSEAFPFHNKFLYGYDLLLGKLKFRIVSSPWSNTTDPDVEYFLYTKPIGYFQKKASQLVKILAAACELSSKIIPTRVKDVVGDKIIKPILKYEIDTDLKNELILGQYPKVVSNSRAPFEHYWIKIDQSRFNPNPVDYQMKR